MKYRPAANLIIACTLACCVETAHAQTAQTEDQAVQSALANGGRSGCQVKWSGSISCKINNGISTGAFFPQ